MWLIPLGGDGCQHSQVRPEASDDVGEFARRGISAQVMYPPAVAVPTGTGYAGATGTSTQGRDVSGPTTDDAMTRSEERLHVGTETVPAGRARLRKCVVTENVTQTV